MKRQTKHSSNLKPIKTIKFWKSTSTHYVDNNLSNSFLFISKFIKFIWPTLTRLKIQANKTKSLYLQSCEEVVLFKDTRATIVLRSLHCLSNVSRVSLLPWAFSFLEHFSKSDCWGHFDYYNCVAIGHMDIVILLW